MDWQGQVRKYAKAKDWDSAIQLVEREIARAPQDMDVRVWRARVLAWSGKLPEAEKEFLEILKVSRTDPSVYLREGKLAEAHRAISTAEELDPKRSDIHATRARILLAEGQRTEAQSEFQSSLDLDPGSTEARESLVSVRRGPPHELRIGQDNDLLSYSDGFHDEWVSVVSQWTSRWTTSTAGNFYQRSGVEAGKFVGSITGRQPGWGALTVGGAIGHDNAVIPKGEAFLELDHGWKIGETGFVRGVEFTYAQHWYWYQSARILALTARLSSTFPRTGPSRLRLLAREARSRERMRNGGLRESRDLDFPSRNGATEGSLEISTTPPGQKISRSWIKSEVLLRKLIAADCGCRLQTGKT